MRRIIAGPDRRKMRPTSTILRSTERIAAGNAVLDVVLTPGFLEQMRPNAILLRQWRD
jgi:hypothetical protein